MQYNTVFKSRIYYKYDTMENKGLKRAMTDLDCTQRLLKFYHASYCGAKQCCLKAIIRWQQGKQHVQEDRKWEGSQGNTRGEALFLDPPQRLGQQMTQRQSQCSARLAWIKLNKNGEWPCFPGWHTCEAFSCWDRQPRIDTGVKGSLYREDWIFFNLLVPEWGCCI